MTWCIEQQLKRAISQLQESGSSSAQLDAAVLLCHVLDKPRSYLLTWPEKMLSEQQISDFSNLLVRRLSGEPVAYIVGEREFWSLSLKVSPSTLIPRPDTEKLVELALDKLTVGNDGILDLGTGTGAIALALASEQPNRSVIGVDIRVEAQQLATENAQRLNINNTEFRVSSWFDSIQSAELFCVIVSNPPYIDELDPHLNQGDVRFEPISALVAANSGLADIELITRQARDFLLPGGWLLLEHGYQQGADVRSLLQNFGYQQVSTEQDYGGNDRVTLGCWS
ncbi:MAG: peptide chain release factor N(5)-glutamine methyltransferase [Aliivibrio sp.]|uniref:peptide chain release factor N(5)-glutamine methyltransferase n=1 Tax=Aliivibrio sp. TaxID=1872443 RepID=UPI001A45C7FB|nr:peptide chain release factor N(5)-glutamine methyltransferase [Aliivibrio sp.]